MLNSLLSFIIFAGWLGFTAWFLLSLLRTWRIRGLNAALGRLALRELLSYQVIIPFILLTALGIIKASLQFIYPHQVGVVISILHEEGIRQNPMPAGLRWIVPLAERVIIYPIYWQTYTMSNRPYEGEKIYTDAITSRTLDSQEVTMDISIIFRIDPEQVVTMHRFWQRRYKEDLLRPSVRAFMRREVSKFTIDEVNSDKRTELENMLNADLKTRGRNNGLIVKGVLLRNIAFSPQYAAAVEYKQVAYQGELAKLHQAKQMENLARGTAAKIKTIAQAEADAVRIRALAGAKARLLKAVAEADALNMIAAALQDRQNLLTYRYIDRLSPDIQAVVLPHDLPLIFPLPE